MHTPVSNCYVHKQLFPVGLYTNNGIKQGKYIYIYTNMIQLQNECFQI